MALQLIFGMTYTNLDEYLLFGKRIIIKVLRNHLMAQVKIPSEKIAENKEMVYNSHPNLHDVWCTMDGLKITLKQSGDALVQEQYYNGWTHDHYVFSDLLLYDKLELVYERDGGKCTVDSAFGNVTTDYFIKSLQELIHIEDHQEQGVARDATSMRQSAEWGTRAFQCLMPRIKDRIKFETRGERS